MCEKFSYCPICQLPLKAINIKPDVHVSMCISRSDEGELEECPQGVHCLSTDVFHYRDYSHKLLAAYRSSSDFVPPEVEIKPSPKKRRSPSKPPKRSSPRKKKTPSPDKSNKKKIIADSDEESDFELLVQTKKPRINLTFNENPKRVPHPNKNKSNLAPVSCKKGLNNALNNSSPSLMLEDETKTAKGNCDPDDVKKESNHTLSETSVKKPSIVDVNLNSGDELRFTKSRSIPSLSSLSVTTSGTCDAGSDIDSETTSGSTLSKSPANEKTKVVFRQAVLTLDELTTHKEKINSQSVDKSDESKNTNLVLKKNTTAFDSLKIDNNKLNADSIEASEVQTSNYMVKEPVLTLERLKVHDMIFLQSKSKPSSNTNKPNTDRPTIESDTNGSFFNADFDHIIPGSMLDKELLKTIEKKLVSPATTLHSCSEYTGNESGSMVSSVSEDGGTDEDNESTEFLDSPRRPKRVVTRKKPLNLLSSSSDSDIPLPKLVSKKPETAMNKMTSVKGKVKAGKVLRISNKAPAYLNGSSSLNNNNLIDTEIVEASDKESDSGKSSAHTDVSFVPSEKTNSSVHSDSALSAQSTDQLTASSASSTYSSSESYSESKSSDPSYSEASDLTSISRSRKSKAFRNKDKISPRKMHLINRLSSLSEESTSFSSTRSEISIRERLLFREKKISPKKSPPKPMKAPAQTKKSFKASTLGLLDTTDSDDKSEWQSLLSKMRSGCYPSDLKIDSEDSLTVVSSCSGSDTSHASAMLPLRQCPFYKKIPDTPFAVDAFQYWNIPGVKIYFLSHFHSDHYIGLKKSFAHPIYCTQITANLVRMKLRVEEKWLRVININEPQIICGVEVTALDANHCPGSAMFLFSLTNGRNHLHVGDFRASKAMTFFPSLRNVLVSKLFLDTTYCSPQYCFPTQENVIARVVEKVKNHVKRHPRTLVVCGSYTIGKEKVFLGVAEALSWQVWVRPEKQRVFACLNDPRINSRLVKDCRSANVHVLPMASLQIRSLQQHLESLTGAFTHLVAIKPTGWELNSKSDEFKVTSRENITIYGVPYSEHSSFTELRDFVQFLQPDEIVPTVNVGNAASRSKMSKHFADWLRPESQTDGKSDKQKKVSQYFKTTC